jgi:hypothetical protein
MPCLGRRARVYAAPVPVWAWIVVGVVALGVLDWIGSRFGFDVASFLGVALGVAFVVGVFGSAAYSLGYWLFDFDPIGIGAELTKGDPCYEDQFTGREVCPDETR